MISYFGIGIENTKNEFNVGTLWRSAHLLGASFIFTIGRRYRKQSSDVNSVWRRIPLFHYPDVQAFFNGTPYDCRVVGVELIEGATKIEDYCHPKRCVYLLGAEDHGLSREALRRCAEVVRLPGNHSLNVATAGSIVLYDRHYKNTNKAQGVPHKASDS